MFTTQVRRGVLRLFGISSVVSPSPPGSASASHRRSPILKSLSGEERCPQAALRLVPRQGTPRHRGCLGSCSWQRLEQEQILKRKPHCWLARSLLLGLLYLSKERRLRPPGSEAGANMVSRNSGFSWKANNAIYNGDGCGGFTPWPASPRGSLRSGLDAAYEPNARS